ncbi:MAG: dihydroxy-acid dehydratase, partial [Lachnospiraceae bacterium]|nr:dihydroxy-acid dehydratase [Lachnospiraceae bacterium]
GRAGGMLNLLGELAKGGLIDTSVKRVNGATLAEDIEKSACRWFDSGSGHYFFAQNYLIVYLIATFGPFCTLL